MRHKAESLDSQGDKNLNGLPREMSGSPSVESFKKKKVKKAAPVPEGCGDCRLEGGGLDSLIPDSLPAPLPAPGVPSFLSREAGRPESKGLALSLVLKGSKLGWGCHAWVGSVEWWVLSAFLSPAASASNKRNRSPALGTQPSKGIPGVGTRS